MFAHIEIPSSVTFIDRDAFVFCTSLNTINFIGTIEQWNLIEKVEDWNYEVPATMVHCTDGDELI